MHSAVDKMVSKAAPEIKALLRTRPYYSTQSLMISYKAHVLSLLEGGTPAIYHASASVTAKIDRVQASFLYGMGISEGDAFLQYNLA